MFRYKVTYFDEIEKRMITESGVVVGETYGKAADRLVVIYGKENLNTMALYEMVEDYLTDNEMKDLFDEGFEV